MARLHLLIMLAAGSAAAPALAAEPATASQDGSKVVCRRAVATGSVMASAINCNTNAGWRKTNSDEVDAYREELLETTGKSGVQAIETGSAKWEAMPELKAKAGHLPYSQFAKQVSDILRKDECKFPGQTARTFDIEVPYAVQVEPDGKATRILVSELGCDPLEALVGSVLIAEADRGDFLPTGEAKARWFKKSINFTLK